jgi:hypothetical protein
MSEIPWWRRSLPGDLGPLAEPEDQPDTERYRLAVARLRAADPDGEQWVSALAAWETLRRLPLDDDGSLVISDARLVEVWELNDDIWGAWRSMLIRAGLLQEAERGYYVNPLQGSPSAADENTDETTNGPE